MLELLLAAWEAVVGNRTRTECLLEFLGSVLLLAALYFVLTR